VAAEEGRPWEADRALSVAGARAAIVSQFPHVEVDRLEYLGSGWEFDVYRSSDGWVFRFPRRGEHAQLFDREERILSVVRPGLSGLVEVPEVLLRGEACPTFPYPFAAHRVVPGISSDAAPLTSSEVLAEEIGTVLSRLHSIPESVGREGGLGVDADGCAEWLAEAKAVGDALQGMAHVVDVGVEWVRNVAAVPPSYRGSARVLHNDLKPEHLLTDPASGRLVGLIDWTDAALGDPVLDFIAL
jgi:macrolide phosphotransferase